VAANHYQQDQSVEVLVQLVLRTFLHLDDVTDRLSHREEQVHREAEQEHDEVFVVPVPQAVVDEGAVVVEVLHTTATDLAMEITLGLNNFIIWAEIVEIDPLLKRLVDYVDEGGVSLLEEARIHERRHEEEEEGKGEKEEPAG